MYKFSQNVLLEISKNGMNAYITLCDDEELDILENEDDNIDKVIKEIKNIIKVGLKEEELRTALLKKYYDEKICIAEGKMPIDGKDGRIKYHFELEKKLIPKVLPDGTVDYRELDIVNNVKEGELLAEIIPPIEGENGYKVTGEIVPYKKGKSPRLRYGKNVKLLDDGLYLVAEKDGLVELKDGKVIVSEVFQVPNLDNKVGNIYFNGTVIVGGNALNGFQIKADGDVEVKGVVEGAYIENSGDVTIKQGIQGYNRLTIRTKGNITTKFVENAIVDAGRNIVAEAIMHSQVTSKENIILLGKKGLIVGGICRAGKEISAKIIGSAMATTTILEVGVDPSIKQRSEQLKDNINIIKDNLDKITKSLSLLDNLKKVNRLDKEKAQMYLKLLKTRNALIEELRNSREEFEVLKEKIENLSRGRIRVSDIIYPGVRIVIGNSTYFVRDEMKRCTFYKTDGEIKVGPY
jgi:uncharacterized protein (DUF342 family)